MTDDALMELLQTMFPERQWESTVAPPAQWTRFGCGSARFVRSIEEQSLKHLATCKHLAASGGR